jgi:Protein of unknown function (DUF3568)
MSPLRRFCVSAIALLALAQGGCLLVGAAAVGGGATGLAIASGKATQTFDGSVAQVAAATQSALEDLGMPVERPHIGEFYGEIDSTLDDGGPVLIDFKAESRPVPADPPRTRVGIHVKVFGDKKLSQRIFDQISHRLNNPAAPTSPGSGSPPPPPLADQTDEPGLAPMGNPSGK